METVAPWGSCLSPGGHQVFSPAVSLGVWSPARIRREQRAHTTYRCGSCDTHSRMSEQSPEASGASPSRRRDPEEQAPADVMIMWEETHLITADLISGAVVNWTPSDRRARPHGGADTLNCAVCFRPPVIMCLNSPARPFSCYQFAEAFSPPRLR